MSQTENNKTVTVNHESRCEVVYHMITVTHDVTGTQVFSGLQNKFDIPLKCTRHLSRDFRSFIYYWFMGRILFYFINFGALHLVQLILYADLFYYMSHTICSLFQFCYTLLQKTEICQNVGPVNLEHLQCISVIKYFLQHCSTGSITTAKFIYHRTKYFKVVCIIHGDIQPRLGVGVPGVLF